MSNPDFKLEWTKEIKELATTAKFFVHNKTKAEVLVLENDDEDKAFSIGFRTIPTDSTGVAHILEHSVLNGSRKYPVKDPFLHMIKTSLKTFLNAYTYPEYTIYPIASQNEQDYYNLVDVYLDAVFFPKISEQILAQEGWHYELESLDSDLKYKGVVFNEMKGSMSNPSSIYWNEIGAGLFPNNLYAYNSGGDPESISDLSYKQFKDFHSTYYHPSNSRAYFYGNGDTDKHLKKLAEYLNEYEYQEVDASVKKEPKFSAAKEVTVTYPVTEIEKKGQSYAIQAWALDSSDSKTKMMWEVLESILIGSDSSILRQKLLESELGEGLAGGGVASGLTQNLFMVGLKGVKESDTKKVHSLILQTLKSAANDINSDNIEAALNMVEFDRREQPTSTARGLDVFDFVLESWYFDRDPLAVVSFEKELKRIREEYANNPKLFSEFIAEQLVENTHRVDFVMNPDPELNSKRAEKEIEKLAKIKAGMSEQELQNIIDQAKDLEKWQKTPDTQEDIDKVPVLEIKDLSRKPRVFPLEETHINDMRVIHHDLESRGITYLKLAFDISWASISQLNDLSLLSLVIDSLGTESKSYSELSLEIDRDTGGIWTNFLNDNNFKTRDRKTYLILKAKVFDRNYSKLVDLIKQILFDIKLDNKARVKQLIMQEKAGVESGLVSSGHSYAVQRAMAQVSPTYAAWESIDGIDNFNMVRDLIDSFDSNWDSILKRLEDAKSLLIGSEVLIDLINPKENFKDRGTATEGIIEKLNTTSKPIAELSKLPSQVEGFTIPADINFVALAMDFGAVGYKLHGSVLAVMQLLRGDYLWNKVRVQGGAYGAFFSYGVNKNIGGFVSYRDPNIESTLTAYYEAGEFLSSGKLSQKDIEGAIIGAIGKMDLPMDSYEKGWTALVQELLGKSYDSRSQLREELLNTTLEDIVKFGEFLTRAVKAGKVVILGNKDKLEEYSKIDPDIVIEKLI